MTSHTVRVGRSRHDAGFSLVELLVASTLTLAVTGAAVSAIADASRSGVGATVVADVNQTLRVAMNTVIRDLIQAGEGDFGLRTGVSIPSGDGVDQIVRPGPPGSTWLFPAAYTAVPAVSPANGIGPSVNGVATDVVTILYEDRSLDFFGVTPAIADDGSTMSFPVGFDMGSGMAAIKAGDLIRFGSGAIQEVTRVDGRTVEFDAAAGSHLNQRDAPQGSVIEMRGGAATFPALPVSRVNMITYYIGASSGLPRLIRRVNYGSERVIAIGVENLQLTWDLVDGVTNPTNVETFDDDGAEGQIRKANLYLAARSQDYLPGMSQPMRTSLSTQVSLRSLAFVSRYDLQN